MFYQNILTEISPYQANISHISGFGEHRHADIELDFCIKGSFEVEIDKKRYTINEGEMILISPMVAHSFPPNHDKSKRALTVVVGVSFLKNFFYCFSNDKVSARVITKTQGSEIHEKLFGVLDETVQLCESAKKNNELLIRGNLYKICSYLIDVIGVVDGVGNTQNKEMIKVANVEKALEMIYYDHSKPLTVEDAAAATGYGKSNFCKIFKSITGETFHSALNRKRVESACALLVASDLSVSQIAAAVGFGETKTFCRVFRSVTDHTPGQYRRVKKAGG